MPVNPYGSDDARPTRAATEFFVGRETELTTLHQFLVDVGAGTSSDRIVHVFGAAGSGKSWLLAKLRADFAKTEKPRLALFDVDAEEYDSRTSAPELLWRLRFALRRAGVRTPLYDLFYAAYFSKHILPGVSISLPGLLQGLGTKSEPIEKSGSVASSEALGNRLADAFDAEFFTDLAEGAGEIAKSMKGVQLFAKLASAFQKKVQRRALKSRGIDLVTAGVKELQVFAPEILASDMLEFARTGSLVIAVDGFDRIQSDPQVLRSPAVAERALESLVRYVMFGTDAGARARIGFLHLGREQLRWSELFDQAGGSDSWSTVVHQMRLRGFTESDARIFLSRADRLLDSAGETVAAQALRASTKAVLTAALEGRGEREHGQPSHAAAGAPAEPSKVTPTKGHPSGESLHSPFRLRLCVEEIVQLRRPFTEDDARRHADDISASFLRNIPERLRDVLHVFALAGEVDSAMYETLVSQGVIQGYAITEYPLLVQRDALFVPIGSGDDYRLHFQLEEAAMTLLAQSASAPAIAAAITTRIFEHRLRHATPPTFALLSEAHLDAYQKAMRLIFRVHAANLLPIDRFAAAFLDLEEALGDDVAVGGSMHVGWLLRLFQESDRWTVEQGQQLVDSHLCTSSGERARTIVPWMMERFHASWVSSDARAAAKRMFTRMYAARVFPPDDGAKANARTLTAMEVLRARTTARQQSESGDVATAEATLRRMMDSLPETLEPADRARFEGDLSLYLSQVAVQRDDKEQAELLLEQAVLRWRAASLEGVDLALRLLEYCMPMLAYLGKEHPAVELLKEIAPILETELPPQHPSRADLATTFAMLCLRSGLTALALPYFETAKAVLIANYGDDDPRVRAHQALIDEMSS